MTRAGTTADLVLIDVRACGLTLPQVMTEISRLRSEMPGHEVFMDGDRYAIVARPRGDALGA